ILEIEFKNVRFKLLDDNQIRIGYQKNQSLYVSQFQSPTCDFFENKPIHNIQGFRPPNEYIIWLSEIAKQQKLNPNLLTGIVAQESGFNPNAISWAKAIGLTQITQLAEEQLRIEEKKWPQSREISSLNFVELKQKISSGEINRDNEWRLNPQKSIQGGAEYIRYLYSYWNLEENKIWLAKISGEPSVVLSQVILASYNSGPSRVKNAIIENPNTWIKDPELKEAHKYIQRVFSYCYHFSQRSVSDDG
ncbi:transglycosylase SLT domain-containing protein, partial [bacterium]|nr:transglycosylase SLT domain-containing protein [bacterium]